MYYIPRKIPPAPASSQRSQCNTNNNEHLQPTPHLQMRYDAMAQSVSSSVSNNWLRHLLAPEDSIPGIYFLARGNSNMVFRMKGERDECVVLRVAMPGVNMFPDEKDQIESDGVPVPFVLHSGSRRGSSLGLEGGGVILMEFVEHTASLYDITWLDPDVDKGRLEGLHGEVARILLKLSQPNFDSIGSLEQIDDFTWEVIRRPLSQTMNALVRLAGLPRENLPSETKTFKSTAEYFEALAELHVAHLVHQRNDTIDSADNCRRKLVARYLFRKLARERGLMKKWSSFDKGPFKLWCDCLSPANILMNEEKKIVGVVDWEFTYTAPPDYWSEGLDDWCCVFERRLQTFLRAMRSEEDEAIEQGWLKSEQRLSEAMRDSWESGVFWISYAARNNLAFDSIWRKIDQRFFEDISCPIEDVWRHRLGLLECGERAEMEDIVTRKLEEIKTRELAWDPDDYTRELVEQGFGENADHGDEAEAEGDDGDVDSNKDRLLFVW
ncbi:hypothetical protein BDV19DRAFT_377816 [Aspergillus venezuelensis]